MKNKWQKVKLREVVNFIDGDRGKNYPTQGELYTNGNCVFLSTNNVPNTRFNFEEKLFITNKKDLLLRKGKLERGDYVLTTRGTVGNFAYYDDQIPFEKVRINSGMVILRCKVDFLERKYLQYFLSSKQFSQQVRNRTTGSAQPQLPIRDLASIVITLPGKELQKQITSLLGSYDSLIEVNEKRIKALEHMAQLLYDEWFVKLRFPGHEKVKMVDSGTEYGMIPEGWEVKRLSEVLELAYGKALKEDNRQRGNIAVYGSGGLVGYHNKKLVTGPGIVVGRKGNVGALYWISSDFFPIDTTYYVTSKLPLTFIFFLLQKQKFVIGDAAVPGLNRNQAYLNKALIPEKEVVKEFVRIVDEINKQISNLQKQNYNLTQTRDLLIPQLVTGRRLIEH